MNASNPSRSKRLARILKLLRDGKEYSTRQIADRAMVCAVSACISELRQAGHVIVCSRRKVNSDMRWFYRLVK